MQALRDLLRGSLAQSLSALSDADRLSAAWPVAAGSAIADRSTIRDLDEGVVTVAVADTAWRNHLRSIAPQLLGDLRRISRVRLTDILFVLASSEEGESARGPEAAAPPRRSRT